MNEINIICIKWGHEYSSKDVNNLYYMCHKNISKYELKFHCFTDNNEGLHSNILAHPLPVLNIPAHENKYSYKKEVGLCDDNLGNLNGKRVLFFDLDVVIVSEINTLIEFITKDNEFYIIRDWNKNNGKIGNASCYSWIVGTLGTIKEDFEKEPSKWTNKFYTASQEYLSYKVIEKFGKLNFFPKEWIVSFKNDCIPPFYLRYFVEPKLPSSAKIIAFHGQPKIIDALNGKWNNNMMFFKKIYKHVLPTKWLKEFLDPEFYKK